MRVAVLVDGRAFDQLHHEVRNAFVGGAAVQQAGDVGMIEAGKNLALVTEAFENRGRVVVRRALA